MKNRCSHTSNSGKPCNTWAQQNSPYCFFHDPEKADVRKQAQSKGGKLKPVMGHEPTPLQSAQDVAGFVAEVINGVRMGKVSKTDASILSTLSQTLLRALELGQLEERITQVESKLGEEHE